MHPILKSEAKSILGADAPDACVADPPGMSNDARAASPAAKVAGIVAVIVLVNVLPRVVGLPDVDLPSISLPELPDWAHTSADVLRTVLEVKNWLLVGLVAVVVVGVAVDQTAKRRERR